MKKIGNCILSFVLLISLNVIACPQQEQTGRKVSLSLRLTLKRPSDQVLAIILSPDDRFLVSATRKRKTEVWDIHAGQLITIVAGKDAAFSPDGQTLATIDGKMAKLWNPNTGKLKHVLSGHKEDILMIVFSPDGRTLATGSEDGTAKVWDTQTGQPIATLVVSHVYPRWRIVSRLFSFPGVYCGFSPDSRKLLSFSFEQLPRLWDVRTGGEDRVFDKKDSDSGIFSPTGKFVLTGGISGSGLWDAATGQLKAEFNAYRAVFSPDEHWLGLVEFAGQKGLFNLETKRIEIPLNVEINDFVSWMKFSPNNRFFVYASGLYGHRVIIFDTKNGQMIDSIRIKAKHGFDIISDYLSYTEALSFHPSSEVLMGANHDLVRLWNLHSGQQLAQITGARDPAAFSRDGKILVTTSKNKSDIQLWDFQIN